MKKLIIAGVLLVLGAGIVAGFRFLAEDVSGKRRPASELADGQWAVHRFAELYGRLMNYQNTHEYLSYRDGGYSLGEIQSALEETGLTITKEQVDLDSGIPQNFPLPHVTRLDNPDEMVILLAKEGEQIVYISGKGYRELIDLSDLQNRWTGTVLVAKKSPQEPVVGTAPRIDFETRLLDAGSIYITGDRYTFEFPFRNTGNAPLTISNVVSGHRDTIVERPTEPIEPDRTGTIRLKIRPKSETGIFAILNKVSTNDPDAEDSLITVTGYAVADVAMFPANISFRKPRPGRVPEKVCHIFSKDRKRNLEVTGVTSDLPHARLEIKRLTPKEIGDIDSSRYFAPKKDWTVYAIHVVIDLDAEPQGLAELYTGEIVITTNVPHFETMRVPLEYRLREPEPVESE